MINFPPSFSSPPGASSFSAPSSSTQAPSWAPVEISQRSGMSHDLIDPNSVGFQSMFTNPFSGPFQPSALMPPGVGVSAPMLLQPGMYAAQDLNGFWKPSPSGHIVKTEPGADLFAPQLASDFSTYNGSQPMMSSMSLPTYAAHAPERSFTFSDAESLCSVASPSSTSEASSRPASAKRGAKRKTLTDVSLDSVSAIGTPDASNSAKSNKKASRQASQRRPPPSASHVTESGKPFPVIDTSAKHSSLFVPPDTSGLTKREARLVKNRAAAFLSRQRKREQFEEMEIKCKGISMLVWRMWEAIAGSDAGVDLVDSTPLASVLANEDPVARLCLEEVISKKGASIAPTADEIEGTPAPESQVVCRPSTGLASAAQPFTDAAFAELERARSDLAASLQRESELAAQLDAIRTSVATAQASVTTDAMPVADFDGSQDWKNAVLNVDAPHSGLTLPFRGVQGAELPLFAPESPMSKFTTADATHAGMMLDASHGGFDLSKTPTLSMFSENALRNRSAQKSINDKAAGGMGLGLDYRLPCASTPSSPSTASSSSMESRLSRHSWSMSNDGAGRAPSTLATILLLASMSLMGVGSAAHELPATEASFAAPRKEARVGRKTAGTRALTRATPAISRDNAGQPSSHLSDDDLLMEMGLDSASLSDEGDEDVEVPMQAESANAIACA
ncbi:uncharacterized protein MEPE_02709 [Melanopsichium pennsylvanicum]|uniref:BZIP domain-containing protein n=2 Tax=Melanopsichium pennsylvanicum TaxID=63383 RepID=A0AAJ5C4S3_9BASI|nr:putative protein [Melanopsichium pennsylvanicum 4]SNX84001.1 uncharacterized protein MEPE_02709 [Melanopsichium pennsylvanicum]